MIDQFCNSSQSSEERRINFHKRKLQMLRLFRDSLERRMSSVNAAINTLETQIERDSQVIE